MLNLLWLVWLIPAPIMAYFFTRFCQNHRRYKRTVLNPIPRKEAPRIVFQFCSRDGPPVVFQAINRVHEVCKSIGFDNYQVDLVVDNLVQPCNSNVVLVPSNYRPPNGCKYKARALQYAIERRKKSGEINKETWIFLLDEESFVTRQTVISLLKYVAEENSAPIAEGPIIYSNYFLENNILCSLGETQRAYICHDCVSQMTSGRMPIHMHGSNLLVRSDVEAIVGWDHKGVAASEDQRFGWEATLRLGPHVFGWHGGMLEEQPAKKIRDYVVQRQRWFVGNIHNIIYSKVSLKQKLEVSFRWLTWWVGFPCGLVTFLALLIPQSIPDILRVPLLVNTIFWLLGYQVGLKINLEPYTISRKKKLMWHLLLLVLTPIVGLIETFGVFMAPLKIRNFVRFPTPK